MKPCVAVVGSNATVPIVVLVVVSVKVSDPVGCMGPNAERVPVSVKAPPFGVAASAVAVVMGTSAQADPSQYLCLVEASAGLHYEKQTDPLGAKDIRRNEKIHLPQIE